SDFWYCTHGRTHVFLWWRERDSNPRYGFPYTRFPSVRLQPLGHSCRVRREGDRQRCRRPRSPAETCSSAAAKSAKCSVLVSTLDRLSRHLALFSGQLAQPYRSSSRTGARRRSIHGPSVRSACREGTPAHFGAHKGALAAKKAQGAKFGNTRNIVVADAW